MRRHPLFVDFMGLLVLKKAYFCRDSFALLLKARERTASA